MISVLLNLLWGLVVTLSFAALGRILARGFWPERRDDFFLTAGWGMAGMVILGGFLNLFGLARASALVVLVIAVIVLETLLTLRMVLRTRKEALSSTELTASEPKERWATLWVVSVVLLAAFKYASSLTVEFNEPDDFPVYLFQAARLLQTGSIGLDPFSDRQLLSLNGQTFLLALVCSVSPVKYAFVLDPGTCWIVLGGLTWSIVRHDLKGSIRDASLFTGLVYMAGIPFINLAGYLTGAVLYLTLIRTSYLGIRAQGALAWGSQFMLALTIASLCALKSTYIVFVGLYMLAWFSLRISRSFIFTLARESFVIGIAAIVLLLPWMYQQYRSGGTFFYPYLGKGFHVSGPGFSYFEDSLTARFKGLIYYLASGHAVPALFGLILLVFNPFREDRDRWRVLLASVFGAAVGSLGLAFYLAGLSAVIRYAGAFLYVSLIPVGLFGFLAPRLSRSRAALAFCLVGFVGLYWDNLHSKASALVQFVKTPGPGSAYSAQDLAQLRRAQASVPPGKRILAWVERGFLLDFTRNPTCNLDLGMISPPPGLPVSADVNALRSFLQQRTPNFPPHCPADDMISYLQHAGIDFVMYQYFQGRRIDDHATKPPTQYIQWMVRTFETLLCEDLTILRSRCKVVYDDGDVFVLDVSSPGRNSDPTKLSSTGQ